MIELTIDDVSVEAVLDAAARSIVDDRVLLTGPTGPALRGGFLKLYEAYIAQARGVRALTSATKRAAELCAR